MLTGLLIDPVSMRLNWRQIAAKLMESERCGALGDERSGGAFYRDQVNILPRVTSSVPVRHAD
jgi:hypothetical protein